MLKPVRCDRPPVHRWAAPPLQVRIWTPVAVEASRHLPPIPVIGPAPSAASAVPAPKVVMPTAASTAGMRPDAIEPP
jgi:hypothetical protein